MAALLPVLPAAGLPAQAVPPTVRVAEAPDARSAMALAKKQGSRVEVTTERTETRTVYADPSGKMAAEITMLPTRLRRGAGWVNPDTTVVRRPDGSVGPAAATVGMSFSAGGTGPMVRLARAGKWFALSWPGRLPKPVLSGSKATYAEVLPGVDLVLRADLGGYAQYLIVKNAIAARNPALAEVRLGLRTGGLTVETTSSGGLEARDRSGAVVFSAPVSRMWDVAGRQAVVKVAVDNSALLLRPDQALLTNPAATFPITIDPVWDTRGIAEWTKVFSGKPTTNYLNGRNDVDADAKVGQCWNGDGRCNGIAEAWSYFDFDTGWLGGRRVLEGSFLTARVFYSPSGQARPHNLHLAPWQIDGGTTWNNKPEGGHLSTRDIPCAGRSGCAGFVDVTFAVGVHVNTRGVSTYYLRAANGGDQLAWRRYDAWQTKLTVQFNNRPHIPTGVTTDPPLRDPCTHCNGTRFFGGSGIQIKAHLADPDGDNLQPMWHIRNSRNEVYEPVGPAQASDTTHGWFVSLDHNTGVDWWVKASDGLDHSADPSHPDGWTHGVGPFWVDREAPAHRPLVEADLYQEDNRWHGGVTVPGRFTFKSNDVSDIDHFVYGWNDPPTTIAVANRLGGEATVSLTPPGDGPRTLYVRSVDRAGHQSATEHHRFYVRAGNGPLAQWSLESNGNDDAFLGDRNASLGSDVRFGPGAVGLGMVLDGQLETGAMSAPPSLRTDSSFSVSAWVKPQPPQSGQVMGAVSVDGDPYNSGFYLSYRGDMKKWAFLMVHKKDELNPSGTYATAPEAPQIGRWTHLTGVYDRPANKIRLYVNGVKHETALPADFVPWHAPGWLQAGRQKCGTARCDPWSGGIDEVKLYDKVLTDADVLGMVGRDDVQTGQWKFDELDGTTARGEIEGGEMLALQGGASFTGDSNGDGKPDGGAVGGAVRLDGVDDFAATSGPAVQTDQSFSVSAWVNPRQLAAAGLAQTFLSQDGSSTSGFLLQQRGSGWTFIMPNAEHTTSWPINAQSAAGTAKVNTWTHVAAVYDAENQKGYLYVDGQQAPESVGRMSFSADGPLTIGRARLNGAIVDPFPGLVDEVRAYTRALSPAEIQGIVSRDDVGVAQWKLDGNAKAQQAGRDGTLHGQVSWLGGQSSVPDSSDMAVRLNGTDAYVSAPNAVDVQQSFSVSAWLKPDRLGGWWVPLSQDGSVVSAFKLQLTDQGHWTFAMFGDDATNGGSTAARAIGTLAQIGVWQHVVISHDAGRRQLAIYVNGVLAGTAAHNQDWHFASGRFVIGADKWNGARGQFFPGAVDDVAVYNRVLFADEIRVMAGRDLTLAHTWALDEPSGSTAADSVGRRTATVAGGANRVPGRLGNAIQLDGTTGRVQASAVDLRTDQNFTVSAWVRLEQTCQPDTITGSCERVAVSLDGSTNATTDSKFRLGHWKDDNHPEGVWMFEMPETDGEKRAAVTIRQSDLGRWTHLAGVYDRTAQTLWLYVDGTRKGSATLQSPWHGTGGLQIGRGRNLTGQPGQFFAGMVDDVRMYSGRLDDDRISNLVTSYPREEPAQLPAATGGHWKLDETTGTTAADSSGRGRAATLRDAASWNAGRTAGGLKVDGNGYAETSAAVVNTAQSFSVAAWVNPTVNATGTETVLGQDGGQVSSFRLEHRGAEDRWGVTVAAADSGSAASTTVLSTEVVPWGHWTHLAAVYDVGLEQLRLYVNGVLSGAQVGVRPHQVPGPFTIGRGKGQNAGLFRGHVDDVRVFDKALAEREVRMVQADVESMPHGHWRFDDSTVRDSSWRSLATTATGTVTYPAGVVGKALAVNNPAGTLTPAYATTQQSALAQWNSFTVSAWVNLASKDRIRTVVAQDGERMSSFVLQYRPSLDRWVFGAAGQDHDSNPLVYAHSGPLAVTGQWVHLTGVYDHAAGELRLYLNGTLSGRKAGVRLWHGWGATTIGRAKFNGVFEDYFDGLIDEVQTDVGVVAETEIARRATRP